MAPRKFDRYMVAVGAGRHAKFARLTDAERVAHFLGVLSIAAQSPIRGCLLIGDEEAGPAEIASESGVTEKTAASAMEKLAARGVLERDEDHDCWRVHDWDDINPAPKTDKTAAERQKRRRDKVKASRQSHATVTPMSRRDGPPVTACVTPPEVEGEVEEEETHPVESPHVGLKAAPAEDFLSQVDSLEYLAEAICGVLQRGIDGLTTEEVCAPPSFIAVRRVLDRLPCSGPVALHAAVTAREIAQSQNRAPNIVGLFEQQLRQGRAA